MKIQIDISENGTIIRVGEDINMGELITFLSVHFPNDKWKEFKLETKTVINWSNPIVIEKQPIYPYYPIPWWERPYYSYCNMGIYTSPNLDNCQLTNGIYNVEVGAQI